VDEVRLREVLSWAIGAGENDYGGLARRSSKRMLMAPVSADQSQTLVGPASATWAKRSQDCS
jgi:hypothetical protein